MTDRIRPPGGAVWQPNADVYRTPDGWLIKLDVAGIDPEDIEIVIDENRFTVRGSRRDRWVEEGWRCYSMEISYQSFERTLELPERLNHARIETQFHRGILLVQLRLGRER